MENKKALTLLGLNVRQLREQKGMTQESLAERSNLDSTYVSGIERGVRNPSILSLVKLAKGFDTTVSTICKGIEA